MVYAIRSPSYTSIRILPSYSKAKDLVDFRNCGLQYVVFWSRKGSCNTATLGGVQGAGEEGTLEGFSWDMA